MSYTLFQTSQDPTSLELPWLATLVLTLIAQTLDRLQAIVTSSSAPVLFHLANSILCSFGPRKHYPRFNFICSEALPSHGLCCLIGKIIYLTRKSKQGVYRRENFSFEASWKVNTLYPVAIFDLENLLFWGSNPSLKLKSKFLVFFLFSLSIFFLILFIYFLFLIICEWLLIRPLKVNK